MILLALLVSLAYLVTLNAAFSLSGKRRATQPCRNRFGSCPTTFNRPTVSLFATPDNNDDSPSGNEESSEFDVDAARLKLQELFRETGGVMNPTSLSNDASQETDFDLVGFLDHIKKTTKVSPGNILNLPGLSLTSADLPLPPPLSTMERNRRETEIRLLEAMGKTDDAMPQLWDLWYSEKGQSAKEKLEEADRYMGDPTSWQPCETILLELISDHSVHFSEAINRLATLYFLQGKLIDSYILCRLILDVLKPWHVGALSGIVQVCIGLGDREEARRWALQRLPSAAPSSSFPPFDAAEVTENPRRQEWVEKRVQQARDSYEDAERAAQDMWGKPDDYFKETDETNDTLSFSTDEDSWQ